MKNYSLFTRRIAYGRCGFLGGSVLCATNTVVGLFLGNTNLCSFCNPEHDSFHKNIFCLPKNDFTTVFVP